MALAAYRQLLRSVGTVFKGDAVMLTAAQREIRSKFEASRDVTDQQQLQVLLEEAREAADFIRSTIVQAKLNERGNYEMQVEERHTGGVAEPVTEAKLPKVKKPQ